MRGEGKGDHEGGEERRAVAEGSRGKKIVLNQRGLVLLYAAAGKTNLSLFVKK